ncbi:MAG: hypothetical protein QOI76_3948 [Frankiales bacterium]|jgi:hypothetical protein|nr:hypothetical protein [Frankiales bacterium]
MSHRSKIALGVTALAGVVLLTGNAIATPSAGLTTKILAKSTFSSTELSGFARVDDGPGAPKPSDVWAVFLKTHGLTDGYVVDNLIDPGGTTGWHSHPGPSIIFVIRGTITNYDSDAKRCAGHDYAAGSSFTDPGGRDVHMLKNRGTVQAETIAVQLLPADAARKTDAVAPPGCPLS